MVNWLPEVSLPTKNFFAKIALLLAVVGAIQIASTNVSVARLGCSPFHRYVGRWQGLSRHCFCYLSGCSSSRSIRHDRYCFHRLCRFVWCLRAQRGYSPEPFLIRLVLRKKFFISCAANLCACAFQWPWALKLTPLLTSSRNRGRRNRQGIPRC